MNTKSITLGLLLALSVTGISRAQQNSLDMSAGSTGKIGKETSAKFDSQNKKGATAVAAVVALDTPLSSADQSLMMAVAKGGMMQLEVSQVALQRTVNPEVKQLAQAEVDEQTGLSAKLQQVATAKGVTLPTAPDADTQAMVSKLQGMSGAALDRMYVTESGVKGHQTLNEVMSKVESSATDSSLKALAKAAHPLVKTHLKVARQLVESLQ